MRIGSLFSGIGGFDLAARWMGWKTAWYSEIDPYCNAVMAKHFPDAKALGDITKVDWSTVERPDLLCGGFPCQPHSVAGKRQGADDARDLWGEFARAIRDLRPRYVVAENVPGLLTSDDGAFFNRVLSDLACKRYDVEWTMLSGADVAAPHVRERVWIVAHTDSQRCQDDARWTGPAKPHRGKIAAPDNARRRAHHWIPQPEMVRVVHGLSRDVDAVAALGNAIVPACALAIFKAIEAREGLT